MKQAKNNPGNWRGELGSHSQKGKSRKQGSEPFQPDLNYLPLGTAPLGKKGRRASLSFQACETD